MCCGRRALRWASVVSLLASVRRGDKRYGSRPGVLAVSMRETPRQRFHSVPHLLKSALNLSPPRGMAFVQSSGTKRTQKPSRCSGKVKLIQGNSFDKGLSLPFGTKISGLQLNGCNPFLFFSRVAARLQKALCFPSVRQKGSKRRVKHAARRRGPQPCHKLAHHFEAEGKNSHPHSLGNAGWRPRRPTS
jgi:hypothetical protein